jgi:G3E family GTPase
MSLFEPDRSAARLPVGIITGFLGSGKTTLLSRLLHSAALADSAVIINEFGAVGLDHLLVDAIDGEMVVLQSGCVCCTIRSDLETALRNLLARRDAGKIPAFRRVLIETTGLADPAPILQMLLNNPLVAPLFRLDAAVTTVDAVHGAGQLDTHPEAVKQVAVADRLLLTKTDLNADVAALEARLRALNAGAPIIKVRHGEVDASLLFGAGPVDPDKGERLQAWLALDAHDDHHDHHHAHDDRIRSTTLIADAPLDWMMVQNWLAALRAQHGQSLLRVKGILNLKEEDGPVVVHGVQHVFHPPVRLPRWPDADTRSRLVFILRDLDPEKVREGFPP